MTKKDYVLIAAAVRAVKDQYEGTKGHSADVLTGDVAQRLADALSNDNPAFNYSKFLSACGY